MNHSGHRCHACSKSRAALGGFDEPRLIGSEQEPRTAQWDDDLRAARGCLGGGEPGLDW